MNKELKRLDGKPRGYLGGESIFTFKVNSKNPDKGGVLDILGN